MVEDSVLVADGLTKRFGGLAALDGVGLAISQGEVRGLIGPNGAGKTTLVNVLSGVLTPTTGSIRFAGREIGGAPAHRLARWGIRRTFQTLRIFPEMSLLGNVAVGYHTHTHAEVLDALLGTQRARREETETMARSREALAFVAWTWTPRCRQGPWPMGASACWSWPAPWWRNPGSCCSTSRRRE